MCDTCLIYCARHNGYTVKQINYIYDISTKWNEYLHLNLNSVLIFFQFILDTFENIPGMAWLIFMPQHAWPK